MWLLVTVYGFGWVSAGSHGGQKLTEWVLGT